MLLILLLVPIEYISKGLQSAKGLNVRVKGKWERFGAEIVDETARAEMVGRQGLP